MLDLTINSKYRMPSGYKIPVLGYGVYQTPAAIASTVVAQALDYGYRHIDSAVAYRNEAASASGIKSAGIPRSEVFYTSKIPPKNLGYESSKQHIENTLKETGFDYVDLYLIHSPYGGREARLGAWRALVEGVREGKVRSIGVSNYGVQHLEELEGWIKEVDEKEGKGAGGVLSVNQVELHPWLARPDIVNWCKERGVVVEAYCPLVRATRGEDPLPVSLAKKYRKTTSQVLLRWSLQMGFVPLPKSVTESRIKENADIFDFELSEDDMKSLNTGKYEPCAWDPTTSKD
ncbi:aldo-keto reductase-like protein [Delitschia confertaspora ATCC 74209]|uniref:Aldo-keto reductase-like protein n=1 Tax=Delitschia confertaspora ATCC 74209 TaxID=1513339 RepID=A0A9P4JPQ7_9PLEO|nr:aldo-keto reductase-like protein [Delitschia confertaspora ATCC 74209]